MLNRLEPFGVGPISRLVSLHGIEPDFSTKNAACDSIVHHLISGACDSVDGGLSFRPLRFSCRFGPFQTCQFTTAPEDTSVHPTRTQHSTLQWILLRFSDYFLKALHRFPWWWADGLDLPL